MRVKRLRHSSKEWPVSKEPAILHCNSGNMQLITAADPGDQATQVRRAALVAGSGHDPQDGVWLVVVQEGPTAADFDALSHLHAFIRSEKEQPDGLDLYLLARPDGDEVFTGPDPNVAHVCLGLVIDQSLAHVPRPQGIRREAQRQMFPHSQGLDMCQKVSSKKPKTCRFAQVSV